MIFHRRENLAKDGGIWREQRIGITIKTTHAAE